MSQFQKNMDRMFDIVPVDVEDDNQEYIPATRTESTSELQVTLNADLMTDYERSRDDMDVLIQKGMEAITDMLSIARESEKARDFEVASNMIRNMIDASKDRLELQKTVRDMTNTKASTTNNNIKNAVFVGSTADLLKSIKENKNE